MQRSTFRLRSARGSHHSDRRGRRCSLLLFCFTHLSLSSRCLMASLVRTSCLWRRMSYTYVSALLRQHINEFDVKQRGFGKSFIHFAGPSMMSGASQPLFLESVGDDFGLRCLSAGVFDNRAQTSVPSACLDDKAHVSAQACAYFLVHAKRMAARTTGPGKWWRHRGTAPNGERTGAGVTACLFASTAFGGRSADFLR